MHAQLRGHQRWRVGQPQEYLARSGENFDGCNSEKARADGTPLSRGRIQERILQGQGSPPEGDWPEPSVQASEGSDF